jgi:ketosteroid isomerase-like protein
MTQPDERLLQADSARRAAMIEADVDALSQYLADELVWTHSSGRTEDKDAVLANISAGTARYLALQVEDVSTSQHGDIFLYHGTLHGRVSRNGTERELHNKFLSVWRIAGDSFQIIALQSTALVIQEK